MNIGITENRLHHSLAVARKCYSIAQDMGYTESFCERMWMIGWNHDVGYEFVDRQEEHCEKSGEMLTVFTKKLTDVKTFAAISLHGKYIPDVTDDIIEWKILNMADLTTDSRGNEIDVSERLAGIKEQYGEFSGQYISACEVARRIGLIENIP